MAAAAAVVVVVVNNNAVSIYPSLWTFKYPFVFFSLHLQKFTFCQVFWTQVLINLDITRNIIIKQNFNIKAFSSSFFPGSIIINNQEGRHISLNVGARRFTLGMCKMMKRCGRQIEQTIIAVFVQGHE